MTTRTLIAPALAALASSAIVVAVSSAAGDPAATAASSPPATVNGTQISPSPSPPFLRPGKVVSAASLGVRTFVNSKDGVAINNGVSLGNVTYPIATVDGGRTWRIDGPALHVPAANAPNVVTLAGAANRATYFVYGGPGGGNSVDVSSDAGKHWYRAYLGGVVAAVVPSAGQLFAFTGQPGAYYSRDGGRVWHYSKSLF